MLCISWIGTAGCPTEKHLPGVPRRRDPERGLEADSSNRRLDGVFPKGSLPCLSKIAIKSYSFVRVLLPGDYGRGVTPVLIPNTEVKPSRADDTASVSRGKVGHCRAFLF